MLPETLVALICTLEKSGCCCAAAVCPQTSAAPASETIIQVRTVLLISLLLRNARGILSLRACDDRDLDYYQDGRARRARSASAAHLPRYTESATPWPL